MDSQADPSTKGSKSTRTVGKHFQLPGHSTRDMEMIPVEIVRGDLATRRQREKNLINRLQMLRFGLNVFL